MADDLFAVAEHEFTLFGVRMRCYVLNDGQRVVDADDVAAFWSESGPDNTADMNGSEPMMRWLKGLS